MSDAYWWADLIRLLMCAAALWLALLVLRMAWLRRQAPEPGAPSVLTYVSYAILLALVSLLRIQHVGNRPTWDLWVAAGAVLVGVIGVVSRVRFNTRRGARR